MWQNLHVTLVKHTVKVGLGLLQKTDVILKLKHDKSVSTYISIVACSLSKYLHVYVLYIYPTGILDREDTLIYSLGLGSIGHDYSIVTEPGTGPLPSPPSNTTRRRRGATNSCRRDDDSICHLPGSYTNASNDRLFTLFRLLLSVSCSLSTYLTYRQKSSYKEVVPTIQLS